MKRILISTALTAGLILSGSVTAGALLIPTQPQIFSFSTLDETTQLSFEGFDTNLGTLHSVHLEWTMDKDLNNKIINLNTSDSLIGNPVLVSATSTTEFSVVGGSIALDSVNVLSTAGFSGVVAGGGAITTVGTVSATNLTGMAWICDDGSCVAGGGTMVTTAELGFFIGGLSLFDVQITNKGSQGGSVPTNVFTGNDGTAVGTVSIVYDYDLRAPANPPIPEPAIMALLGLGLSLAGIQGAARRKQVK